MHVRFQCGEYHDQVEYGTSASDLEKSYHRFMPAWMKAKCVAARSWIRAADARRCDIVPRTRTSKSQVCISEDAVSPTGTWRPGAPQTQHEAACRVSARHAEDHCRTTTRYEPELSCSHVVTHEMHLASLSTMEMFQPRVHSGEEFRHLRGRRAGIPRSKVLACPWCNSTVSCRFFGGQSQCPRRCPRPVRRVSSDILIQRSVVPYTYICKSFVVY